MEQTPEIARLKSDVRAALKVQGEASAAHDAAVAKLESKRKDHTDLQGQLEIVRQEQAQRDSVDAKALAVLSNIRENLEISERQLKRLASEAEVAAEIFTGSWLHDTIPIVRNLRDHIKNQLTQEARTLISNNFEASPFIHPDQAIRAYKPLHRFEGLESNINGLYGDAFRSPEEKLNKAKASAERIEQLVNFN